MVVVRISDGLGNQMFQYAAGRSLAEHMDTNFKLDTMSYLKNQVREYSLKHLNIDENFSSILQSTRARSGFMRGMKRTGGAFSMFKERAHSFNDGFFDLTGNIYLAGFWQSEKYFSGIEPIIRREFTLKQTSGDSLAAARMIDKTEGSVALHIRRGDYIYNPIANAKMGTCDLDYYYEALKLIASRIDHPRIFVFSDDPEWVQANLKVDFPTTFITHNCQQRDHEDIWLMSLCQHNITANSSFSWWGAWLNNNPDKIVCAPMKWFKSPAFDTADLYPEGWHVI